MLMFIVLWWLIMLQMKFFAPMVKDLNPQSGGK
jgi:Mg2+/citrate symporter